MLCLVSTNFISARRFPLSFVFHLIQMAFGDSIRVENGYQKDSFTHYPVLIIGAGESGLAMGCRLKQKLGFDQFRIFDRQSGIGGEPNLLCV